MLTRQHCYHSVNIVTLENGQCQLCYRHVIHHLITESLVINLILRICEAGTFHFHCRRFHRARMTIRIIL